MNASQRPAVSVIIPVLNEAATLSGLLLGLKAQHRIDLELIVCDGGSTDGTPESAAAHARVVKTARGRGLQMNAGARLARGDYLLFLHADSGIEDPELIARALETLRDKKDRRVAGHFRLRFIRASNHKRLAWRYVEEKTAFNRPFTTNGDQGLLIQKRWFEELGGFDESLPFLEDQRLAEKIRAEGRWITLPGVLATSARRFETEGFSRRYLLMAIVMGLHYAGMDAFFQRAPQVYQAQHETGRLLLTPFFDLIRQIQRERGMRDRFVSWLQVGRFVRANVWQLFYFLDVLLRPLLGPTRYPALAFHDRIAEPFLRCRCCDAAVGLLVLVWVMGVFRLWYRLREDPVLRNPLSVHSIP